MAQDASRVLGSPQLAAAKVWHRGTAWRNTVRVNYSADAILLAPLVAWMLYGGRPDLDPAQTPRLGGAALLAVTKDDLVLVRLRRSTPTGVIARVPLREVRAFELDHARGVWPLTITFGDGDTWRLEVPRFNKKAASAVAVAVSGRGQPSYPGLGPGTGPPTRRGARYRTWTILAAASAVVVAGIAIGVLSSRGHGTAAPGTSPTANHATRPAAASKRVPGRIGSSFAVQDGTGHTYQVTLVKVIDPAHGAGAFNTAERGTRLVAAVFRITAVTGNPSEDADNDAALVGSNGQTYLYSFDDIAGYTNFSNGVIHVAQGRTTSGAVSFQLPDGVQITDIQWTAANGFGTRVEWADGSPPRLASWCSLTQRRSSRAGTRCPARRIGRC
jgi:hypothetical protein